MHEIEREGERGGEKCAVEKKGMGGEKDERKR